MPIGIRPEYKRGISTKKIQKKAMRIRESKTTIPTQTVENLLGLNDVGKLEDLEVFEDNEESKKSEHDPPLLTSNKHHFTFSDFKG